MDEQTVLEKLSQICLKDAKEMRVVYQDTANIVPQVEHVLKANRILSTFLQIREIVKQLIQRIEDHKAVEFKKIN